MPTFKSNITCSDLDSERLKKIAPTAHTITVPNGVDVDYFRPQAREVDPDTLVFVGSLNWYPNVDAVFFLLREIWPQLKLRLPKVRLDIVGSVPSQRLIELAASLEGVRIHGFVDDVRPLIQRAAVYVCPIRDGGGTKLKVLCAFAMAKCVVAHPIACEGIDALPGVHVEHATEAREFVAAIERLMIDSARRDTMGLAARRFAVECYSFERISQQLAQTFRSLASDDQG